MFTAVSNFKTFMLKIVNYVDNLIGCFLSSLITDSFKDTQTGTNITII